MTNLTSVQQQLANLLQAGHTLTVRWDCGGDESFVTTEVDGQVVDADFENETDFAFSLDRYLTELLELPDAGEFQMQGTGRIYQQGSDVLIEYQSRAEVYWEDFGLSDEELRELGVELPARPAEGAPPTTTSAGPNGEAHADEENESKPTYDPDMSAAFSGQRVLFSLTNA